MEPDGRTPLERINSTASLPDLLERASSAFELGAVSAHTVIEHGVEDCNVDFSTEHGRFLAKIFRSTRPQSEVDRNVSVLSAVAESDVMLPQLHSTGSGEHLYKDAGSGDQLIVMEFVSGKSYLDLDRAPTIDELALIVAEAAKINALDIDPPHLFDIWAIPNIEVLFREVAHFLSDIDRTAVQFALDGVIGLNAAELPRAFVHGDIIKSNVILSADGLPHIVDFSSSNTYARVQELAVIAVSLLSDSETSLRSRIEVVGDMYDNHSRLSRKERVALQTYAIGAAAMEFMGGVRQEQVNGVNTEENEFWLDLGRRELHAAVADFR